ncbi:hypothetical protein EDC01DRAFT_194319 [Geopyxis carbonaria]|nr:hypothetical protein EDC01DRAFT_194319 [Geopyxis carbonaria]
MNRINIKRSMMSSQSSQGRVITGLSNEAVTSHHQPSPPPPPQVATSSSERERRRELGESKSIITVVRVLAIAGVTMQMVLYLRYAGCNMALARHPPACSYDRLQAQATTTTTTKIELQPPASTHLSSYVAHNSQRLLLQAIVGFSLGETFDPSVSFRDRQVAGATSLHCRCRDNCPATTTPRAQGPLPTF